MQGSNITLPNGVFVKALSTNTGKMYVGGAGDGTVSSSTGFELSAGNVIFVPVTNLKDVFVDSSVNGEKVCWMKG